MFLSDLILTFSNGSFGFKISIILFILSVLLLITSITFFWKVQEKCLLHNEERERERERGCFFF